MGRYLCALATAMAISGVALSGQAPRETRPITPQDLAAAKNLMQDVQVVGCIRLWKPAPDDPKQMPPDRQPGLAGVYLLTPTASSPITTADMPTYLLTPSATQNFSQHVGHKVEISGIAQAAPLPPTVQETVAAPTERPENKPSTNGMPRLTVTTMKMVTESCP